MAQNVIKPLQNIASKSKKALMNLSIRRMRASAQSLTCELVRSMGSSVTTLEVNDILMMDNKEFLFCAEQFGKYYGYSNELFDVLKTKLMPLLNQTNMLPINDDIVVKLGYLASFFNSTEMDTWVINKMDTLSSLRELNFSKSQVLYLHYRISNSFIFQFSIYDFYK